MNGVPTGHVGDQPAVALVLVPDVTAWWESLVALALLCTFSTVLAFHLSRGHTPDCHCFGNLHTGPIGWRTLGRNLVLAPLATGIVVHGWREAPTTARVEATPSAVLVQADGRIGSWVVSGSEQIQSLARHALSAANSTSAATAVSEPAFMPFDG